MSINFSIKVDTSKIQKNINNIQKQLTALPQEAYNYFVNITPKDTGAARRNTKLVNNSVIEANYPYAQRLDQGWSRQYGGMGMTKPTQKFIERRLRKIIGRSNGQ